MDNIMKSADRRLYSKKHGDGEDPIIIAQRFLNIFRQLHIFSAERKNAFNKMILEQPAEIRGMFGSLPGGSLLQEYVDDLEQQSGVTRDHSTDIASNPELSDEISKAKILATALAEAQIQASAKLQQTAPQAAPAAPAAQTQATAPQTNTPFAAGPSKIVADASFAKEIAAAFAQAVKYSEDNRKSETKEITDAILSSQEKIESNRKQESREIAAAIIASQEKMAQVFSQSLVNADYRPAEPSVSASTDKGLDSKEILNAINESQNRMAQMIMQHNNVAASNSSNNNANNIQINTTPMPPIEDIVKGIVKAQSELFREMSQTQTKELSAIITLALKESQQLSTQTIVEAITALQKENMKFFEKQASQTPHYAPQAIYTGQTAPLPKEEVSFPLNNSAEKNEKPLEKNEETLAETPNFDIIGEFGIQPEKNDEEHILDDAPTEILDQLVLNDDAEITENPKKKKKKKKKKNKNKDNSETIPSDNDSDVLDFGSDSSSVIDNGGLDISLFDTEDNLTAPKKKKNKSKKASLETIYSEDTEELSAGRTEHFEASADETAEEETEWTWEEVPADEAETTLEASAEETAEEETEWTWEEVPADEAETTLEASADESAEEETEWTWEEVPADEAETTLEASADETAEEETEWTWEEVPANEESSAENTASENESAIEAEFENIEENENTPSAVFENEWDYEEQTTAADENTEDDFSFENLSLEPNNDAILSEDTSAPEMIETAEDDSGLPENLGSETNEYNFEDILDAEEFSDEPTEETTETSFETTGNSAEASEEEEWEWEYEEVPEEESEDNTPPSASELSMASEEAEKHVSETSDTAEEGEDWEWEYEEIPEDESLAAPEENALEENDAPTAETASEQEDGEEWEWEYEEVPEDENITDETEAPLELEAETETASTEESPLQEEGEDWEWEYEEVPEEESLSEDTSSNNAVTENIIAEEATPTETNNSAEEPDTGGVSAQPSEEEEVSFGIMENPEIEDIAEQQSHLNPLHNGDLYFQDDIYKEDREALVPLPDIDLGIADISDENDKKEPYISKDDIIG